MFAQLNSNHVWLFCFLILSSEVSLLWFSVNWQFIASSLNVSERKWRHICTGFCEKSIALETCLSHWRSCLGCLGMFLQSYCHSCIKVTNLLWDFPKTTIKSGKTKYCACLEEEIRLEIHGKFEGTVWFLPAFWKGRKTGVKGGGWKMLLRGSSRPSQPELEHIQDSPGGTWWCPRPEPPPPHWWLLTPRHCYFQLSQLLWKGWFSASFPRPWKAASGILGDGAGPTSQLCPLVPQSAHCASWWLSLANTGLGHPLPALQLDVGLHGEGAEARCYF